MNFLPADILSGKIRGPIGRDPMDLPVYAMDEKTVIGHLRIYVSEEMCVDTGSIDPETGRPVYRYLQVLWKDGVAIGVCDFGQPYPTKIAPDAITMHPISREVLLKSSADTRQRYRDQAAPTFGKKYPAAVEAQRRHRKTLH